MGFFTSAADEQQKIEQILAQFPGPVTLYPSRRRWTLIALVCTAFVWAGILLIRSGTDTLSGLLLGWFFVVVFVPGIAISFVQMLRGASSMTLDNNGFRVVSLYRRYRHSWRDVARFSVWRIQGQRMVVFDELTRDSRLLALNAAFTGRNSGLSDTYGFKAATLAKLMTRWQERALQI